MYLELAAREQIRRPAPIPASLGELPNHSSGSVTTDFETSVRTLTGCSSRSLPRVGRVAGNQFHFSPTLLYHGRGSPIVYPGEFTNCEASRVFPKLRADCCTETGTQPCDSSATSASNSTAIW